MGSLEKEFNGQKVETMLPKQLADDDSEIPKPTKIKYGEVWGIKTIQKGAEEDQLSMDLYDLIDVARTNLKGRGEALYLAGKAFEEAFIKTRLNKKLWKVFLGNEKLKLTQRAVSYYREFYKYHRVKHETWERSGGNVKGYWEGLPVELLTLNFTRKKKVNLGIAKRNEIALRKLYGGPIPPEMEARELVDLIRKKILTS